MDNLDRPLVTEPTDSTAIPIAQLSPDVDRLQQSSIHAVVTLLWPYSSSTKSFSLLLAEPDFRLRRSNGQVKVIFHGHVAEEVARTHIGIGDNVRLGFAGSRLAKNDAAIQTPGKGVSWDVHFDASASLEVWRNSELLSTVKVDRSSTTPLPTDILPAAPSTPAANGSAFTAEPLRTTVWQSPAFLGRSRISFGHTDPAIDPTVEEDGYVPGKGRKRPRFSMRSNEWRLVDEPESPRDRELPEDWMAIFDEELANGSDAGEETVAQDTEDSAIPPSLETVPDIVAAEDIDAEMVDAEADASASPIDKPIACTNDGAQFLHPSIVSRGIPETEKSDGPNDDPHLPTDTPRLHPIPSPGLPAPSPFPTAPSPGGYFMPMTGTTAASEATVSSTDVLEGMSETVESAVAPPEPRDAEPRHADEVNVASEAVSQEVEPTTSPLLQHDVEPAQTGKDDAVPKNVPERDGSASPPQVQCDGEPTHDEDDAVTVYTDDVQVLPSSPSPPHANVTKGTTVVHEGVSEGEEVSSDIEIGTAKAVAPNARRKEFASEESESDESGSGESDSEGSESESGSEESDSEMEQDLQGKVTGKAARVDARSSAQETDRANAKQLPEQEIEYESDGVSSEWSEDEVDAEAEDVRKNGKARPVQRKSISPEESGDESEDSRDSDEYAGKNGMGQSEEDASDPYDYEEDYDDGEGGDRRRTEYDYSESEVESDYEEELPSRPAPKISEPEIIVLDSESEYDTSAQRPADKVVQEKKEVSEEDSYSEDESQVEQEVYDEEDVKDDGFEEGQEDQDDYEREAEEYRLDEQMEDADEDRADVGPIAHGPVNGRFESEQDRMHEDVHEDSLAEGNDENNQVQPEIGVEATPAESTFENGHAAFPSEVSTSHEFLEATHDYPQGQKHGSLDYLATVSESAQRPHSVSEATNTGFDMAIDPSLYEFATSPVNAVKPDEQDERLAQNNDETAIESPGTIKERHLALQLDGAAPSTTVPGSTEEMDSAPNDENQQLITPGPSQQIKVDQAIDSIEPPHEMLPTPSLTQETLVKLEAEQPPQILTETSTFGVLGDRNSSPVAAIKSEHASVVSGHEEIEPSPPIILVGPPRFPSPSEDQMLQASIEVDEQTEEAIDETNHTPIDRHYPGLRSKLSYFAPLATLIDHYNALVDTISIASEITPATKATTGKKDFILSLQLTDPSMAGTTICAQIFRPFKQALPTVNEGDAILLRNFRVKSFDHSFILVSEDTSAWAVFSPSSPEPETNGPPVEYGAEEKTFTTGLRQWYIEDGLAMVADNQLQASVGREMSVDREESRANTPGSESLAPSDAASIGEDLALREIRGDTSSSRGSRRRKSHRRITIHELRDGRRYTEVGSSPGDSSIHELRDGTVYANL